MDDDGNQPSVISFRQLRFTKEIVRFSLKILQENIEANGLLGAKSRGGNRHLGQFFR